MSIPKGNLNNPTDALVNLMNQFNNFTDDEKKMYLIFQTVNIEIQTISKILQKILKGRPYLFSIWMFAHLLKNFYDFNILLSDLKVSFDILAITETRIKKDSSSPINLQLSNYSTEHTPTELSAGGTLLYISKRLSYQLRNDLRFCDPGKIESPFIEIIC